MENFEDAALALLTEHADRIDALELAHKNLYLSLILALKQSGVDLVKAMSFIESRRPTLDAPVVAELVPTLKSPSTNVPSGHVPTIVGVRGSAGDGG
jgi:hypothetical protein